MTEPRWHIVPIPAEHGWHRFWSIVLNFLVETLYVPAASVLFVLWVTGEWNKESLATACYVVLVIGEPFLALFALVIAAADWRAQRDSER